jgi:hypothetical protein
MWQIDERGSQWHNGERRARPFAMSEAASEATKTGHGLVARLPVKLVNLYLVGRPGNGKGGLLSPRWLEWNTAPNAAAGVAAGKSSCTAASPVQWNELDQWQENIVSMPYYSLGTENRNIVS